MSYLDQLLALRQAVLDALMANPEGFLYDSYSLDGESWSKADLTQRLETLGRLIFIEQNRVPGRREMRVIRGRRWGAYGWR